MTRPSGWRCRPISTAFEPVEPMLSRSQRHAAGQGRAEHGRGFGPASPPTATRPKSAAQAAPNPVGCSTRPKRALAPGPHEATPSAFLGALNDPSPRRGPEALLIVVAMLAFVRKADRTELARPIHYGWTGALAAGALTWLVATSLISVSGASRELTEGFGSLLAAAILSVRWHLDARKGAGGPMATLHSRKLHSAVTGNSADSCSRSPSSPSTARSLKRSSSSRRWRLREASAA